MLGFYIILGICVFLIVYHHVVYPRLVKVATTDEPKEKTKKAVPYAKLPRIGVFIAAHNEGEFIEHKLLNLGCQLYPHDKLGIHVVLDGCTDNTLMKANDASKILQQQHIMCEIIEFKENQGKVAALNHLIEHHQNKYDVIIFTDVSAMLSIDSFQLIAQQCQDNNTAVVTGNYQLLYPSSVQQTNYWQYQNQLRTQESELASVIGVPGAMFAIKSEHVSKIAPDTINDDFILSMQALDKDNHAKLDKSIHIVELEPDNQSIDLKRRVRIGAGNWQQVFRLKDKFLSNQGWLSISFFSHKVLRAMMPFCFMGLYIALIGLSVAGQIAPMLLLLSLGMIHFLGFIKYLFKLKVPLPVVDKVNYVIANYAAACYGIFKYIGGGFNKPWQRVNQDKLRFNMVIFLKRVFDITGAGIGLLLSAPVMLLVAIAIKIDSKGPVLYQQLRVGIATDQVVQLIYIYKLRSMYIDAESKSGAVWASENDPRITRVGRFIRATRLDELPQLWNVLIGEMSLIGPRPERPIFYSQLEENIPYFSNRTYQLKPGISGLAQVMNGYDENLDDVRNKIAWDYAYSLSMSSITSWMIMEWDILIKTIKIVVLGKGR